MKFIRNIAFVFMALCMLGLAVPISQGSAAAFTPQSYWNGDLNYPLAFSQGGANRYVKLSSAKIEEQSKGEITQMQTAVFSYDVVMVYGDKVTTFPYTTKVQVIDGKTYIFAKKGERWTQLSDRSFDQPQYNAALILIDHFKIAQ